MSPDKQRIAIAEACGYWFGPSEDDPTEYWHHRDHPWVAKALIIPDYLNDLNAMHEAEKCLAPDQLSEYEGELVCLRGENFAYATAAERAEAFLKTTGKWEEGK